jgi:hypothetical protein
VNARIAVEMIYGGHEAIPELLLGRDADVAQDGTGEFGKEAQMGEAILQAFDLLELNGDDRRSLSLGERKKRLRPGKAGCGRLLAGIRSRARLSRRRHAENHRRSWRALQSTELAM